MGCVYSSRRGKSKTDTVKDSEDVDVGLVLPRRTRVSHATSSSVFYSLNFIIAVILFLSVNFVIM